MLEPHISCSDGWSHHISYFLLILFWPTLHLWCTVCIQSGYFQPFCSCHKQLVNDRGSNDALYYFPKVRYVWGYKQPFWQPLQSICLSACLLESPKQQNSVHLLSAIDFGTFHLFHLQPFLNGGCVCDVSHGENEMIQNRKREQGKGGFTWSNKAFLIRTAAFAVGMWSIYSCHTDPRTTTRRTQVWILIRTVKTSEVAHSTRSCWISLCFCDSMLACRVLMAARVQPQRLA